MKTEARLFEGASSRLDQLRSLHSRFERQRYGDPAFWGGFLPTSKSRTKTLSEMLAPRFCRWVCG